MHHELAFSLPELAFKRFEREIERDKHANAAAIGFHFGWLFPDHRLLRDIVRISREKCEQFIQEKRYSDAGYYFELIGDLESGSKAGNFLLRLVQTYDLTLGGFCPWCGSNRLWGRKGWLWRYCKKCKVRFHRMCPICKSPHLSWTWNPEEKEFGCDRCQNVASPEELEKGKFRPSPYSLKKEPSEKKKS